jgi:methylmalonyl-CoA carboxyltransferase 12S subunit
MTTMMPTGAEHKPETGDWASVVAALGALRQEVARLGERVAALEAGAGKETAPASVPVAAREATAGETPAAAPMPAERPSEELVLVIGAAIAAFLGKKPHIRQIRLLGSGAWAQQGRVTIQASHTLSVSHHR